MNIPIKGESQLWKLSILAHLNNLLSLITEQSEMSDKILFSNHAFSNLVHCQVFTWLLAARPKKTAKDVQGTRKVVMPQFP